MAFSAALEKGLVKPTDRIDCQMGSITVAKRVIHDHKPFGTLNNHRSPGEVEQRGGDQTRTCRLATRRCMNTSTRFGFGSRTGIELPGETAGILHPLKRWQPSSIGSVAIGQEIGVTPLQMAAAFGSAG